MSDINTNVEPEPNVVAVADETVTFDFVLPGEKEILAARFLLTIDETEASFSLDSESQEEKVATLLRSDLEKCSIAFAENPEWKLSDKSAVAVQKLAKEWLYAYSGTTRQTLPAPPMPALIHERSDATLAVNMLDQPSKPWMMSRMSTISSSASSTTTLNTPASATVLILRLDDDSAASQLLIREGSSILLDEELLARMSTSKWEIRQQAIYQNSIVDGSLDSIAAEKAKFGLDSQSVQSEPARVQTKKPWWKLFGPPEWTGKAPIAVAADGTVIVLPTPPSDNEKVLYTQTRRVPLYLFGTFSFLAVSVGMWFYVIQSPQSWWFGFFVGLIEIYLIISYIVGYFGKDFNWKEHQKILSNNPIKSDCPSVDIYLPCCGEPLEILENTYKYVAKLDYPKVSVYVLDDGGLDTVKRLAKQYGFTYFCRDNRPHLKKAGNLRWAFPRTSGDFFVIYDADFCPRADFLKETIPHMINDPNIAILQTPQYFRPCQEQTWVEQGASATQELFYRVVQVNRDRWGASICVGSNAVYRRHALEPVGGTAEIGHSEDVHTGFYAITRGWRLKYMPIALACGVSPDTPKAMFAQQMRWCAGSTQLLSNPDFWVSKLSIIQKICFLSGFFYYSCCGLMIFIIPFPGLFQVWVHPEKVFFYNCFWAVPSLLYSIIIFRLWSRQRYNLNVQFVFVIQSYAYLMAVKDKVFNTTAAWVPSGNLNGGVQQAKDKKKKKASSAATKYRNSRILCFIWQFSTFGALVGGMTYRILQGYKWYNFVPILVFDIFQLFSSLPFIFRSS